MLSSTSYATSFAWDRTSSSKATRQMRALRENIDALIAQILEGCWDELPKTPTQKEVHKVHASGAPTQEWQALERERDALSKRFTTNRVCSAGSKLTAQMATARSYPQHALWFNPDLFSRLELATQRKRDPSFDSGTVTTTATQAAAPSVSAPPVSAPSSNSTEDIQIKEEEVRTKDEPVDEDWNAIESNFTPENVFEENRMSKFGAKLAHRMSTSNATPDDGKSKSGATPDDGKSNSDTTPADGKSKSDATLNQFRPAEDNQSIAEAVALSPQKAQVRPNESVSEMVSMSNTEATSMLATSPVDSEEMQVDSKATGHGSTVRNHESKIQIHVGIEGPRGSKRSGEIDKASVPDKSPRVEIDETASPKEQAQVDIGKTATPSQESEVETTSPKQHARVEIDNTATPTQESRVETASPKGDSRVESDESSNPGILSRNSFAKRRLSSRNSFAKTRFPSRDYQRLRRDF